MNSVNRATRILVIEDNPGDILLLRLAFEEAGVAAEVSSCGDGESAIARLASGDLPPDAVILDLHVPCRDGLEVLHALRESENWANVPVFVFTASLSPRDRAKVERFGAEFHPKPRTYSGFLDIAVEIGARFGAAAVVFGTC